MTGQMQECLIKIINEGIKQGADEKDKAGHIKKAVDQMYGKTWHCAIGDDFGASFTYATPGFLCIKIGPQTILVWNS